MLTKHLFKIWLTPAFASCCDTVNASPCNTKHLYNIYTMLEQCRRCLGRRGLYKCYTNVLRLMGDVGPIIQPVGLSS